MSGFSDKYLHSLSVGNIYITDNVLMAPLAGYTNYPFRKMCRELGSGMTFTEMVSVSGLKYDDRATARLLFTPHPEIYDAVQLLGSDPSAFEAACKGEYTSDYEVIDINMGCPVPNVIKSGEGCALMNDLPRASAIIEACKRSGKTVTVKFRIGMNENRINAVEFAKICENSGADMLTVHGRTRSMMYDGEPLYQHIAEVKQKVSIPVIANGGISSEDDAVKMMSETGADGIMLARSGFEDPLLFSVLTGKKTEHTKYSLIMNQIDVSQQYFDELYTLNYIKKLTSYFMKKQPGTKQYKQSLYCSGSIDEIKQVIMHIFPQEIKK